MATTPVTPAPSSTPPPSSNYDRIVAASSASSNSEPSQAEPEPEAAATEAEPQSPEAAQIDAITNPETAAVEPEKVAEAAATEDNNPYDEPEVGELPPQSLDAVLKTPEGKAMYQSHKIIKAISKPFAEGGIGHIPTAEQAREYYGAYRDRQLMEHHIATGDPTFLKHAFLNPDGSPRPNGEALASQIAPTLATNPTAYAAAAEPFMRNYETALWERFDKETDPVGKEAYYQAAQRLHYDLTGKWKEGKGAAANPAPGQPDPLAAEREEIARQREEIARFQQGTAQQQQQARVSAVNTKILTNMDAELEKAIGKHLTAVKQATPKRYDRDKAAFLDEVIKAVPEANPYNWDIYNTHRIKALSTGDPALIEQVAKEYVELARPVIAAKRAAFLKESGVTLAAQSAERHAELRSTDSHRAPSNGGSAPRPAAAGPITRGPTESQADFNLRLIQSRGSRN